MIDSRCSPPSSLHRRAGLGQRRQRIVLAVQPERRQRPERRPVARSRGPRPPSAASVARRKGPCQTRGSSPYARPTSGSRDSVDGSIGTSGIGSIVSSTSIAGLPPIAGPESTRAARLARLELREPRRHDATHRVADEHDGAIRMIVAGRACRRLEVVDHVVDALDERPLALRAPVSEMIWRVHRGAVPDEVIRDVRVARRVLAVAVRDQRRRSAGARTATRAATTRPRRRRARSAAGVCMPDDPPRSASRSSGCGLPGVRRVCMVDVMSLLRFLGLGHGAPDGARVATRRPCDGSSPPSSAWSRRRRDTSRASPTSSDASPARIADVSPDETRSMERIVMERGGLAEEQAILVVQIAKSQHAIFGGTEDYLVTREFAADRHARAEAGAARLLHRRRGGRSGRVGPRGRRRARDRQRSSASRMPTSSRRARRIASTSRC